MDRMNKKNDLPSFICNGSRLLVLFSLITATVTGFLLALNYIPIPARAALSISNLQENTFAGSLLYSIHHLCGILLPLSAALYLFTILIVKQLSEGTWRCAVLIIIFSLCFGASGFILGGTNVAMYALKTLLVKAGVIRHLSLTAPAAGNTLQIAFVRIYLFHILLMPAITLFVLWYYRKHNRPLVADKLSNVVSIPFRYVVFCCAVILIAFIVRNYHSPIVSYTHDPVSQMPFIFKAFIYLSRNLSFPIAIVVIISAFVALFFGVTIIRRFKK